MCAVFIVWIIYLKLDLDKLDWQLQLIKIIVFLTSKIKFFIWKKIKINQLYGSHKNIIYEI